MASRPKKQSPAPAFQVSPRAQHSYRVLAGQSLSSDSKTARAALQRAQKTKGDVHVVPHEGKWAARSEGKSRVAKTTNTKSEAVKAAKAMARSRGAAVIDHTKDGKIAGRTEPRS